MKKEHSTEDGRIPPVVHSVNKDQERTRRREREMTSEKTRSNKIVNVKNKTDKKNFTFECKHCSYKCRKKIGLQKHMLGVHREVCPEELIVRLLRCPHDGCSVEFVEHSALKNHMTLVHGHRSKLHVCGDCGAEFLTASSLSGHMRQHKEKTITCPHNGCNYKTHTNLHLKTHIKHKHMGEEGRDHLCHLCGYRCHSRGNLKLHLLNRHHMDLRFKRIRKKGQQVVNALENEETLPTQRETKTSGSHEKNGADGTIGYDAQSAVQDEDLTNNNQQTDITSVVATMSTPVLSVTQSQLSQVESQSDIYLHTHAVLQGDLAGDLQVEGHIQTDVNNLGSDLEHSTCSTAGVKAHLSVPQNDFYHQESVIKTNISLSNDRTLEHRANDPPTHVNTSQYDVRNQNYPSYMTSPNTWHYQGDYNAHYLHPSASFTPSTIHPEEYAQLMNHSQEHIGHSRNLDLMTNQTDTYLPPIEEHHYSPNSGWKFK